MGTLYLTATLAGRRYYRTHIQKPYRKRRCFVVGQAVAGLLAPILRRGVDVSHSLWGDLLRCMLGRQRSELAD